jgi:hypothetical protein
MGAAKASQGRVRLATVRQQIRHIGTATSGMRRNVRAQLDRSECKVWLSVKGHPHPNIVVWPCAERAAVS